MGEHATSRTWASPSTGVPRLELGRGGRERREGLRRINEIRRVVILPTQMFAPELQAEVTSEYPRAVALAPEVNRLPRVVGTIDYRNGQLAVVSP